MLTRRQAALPAKGTDQVRSPELPDGGLGCRAEVGAAQLFLPEGPS